MKQDNNLNEIKVLSYFQEQNNALNFFNYSNINKKDSWDYIRNTVSGTDLLKLSVEKFLIKFKLKKDEDLSIDINKVIDKINNLCKSNLKKSIIVFAPYSVDGKDGYLNRIDYIDETILKNFNKIYINCCGDAKYNFDITSIDDKHTYITFNSFKEDQLDAVLKLVRKVKRTYTHSIHMFMLDDVNAKLLEIFDDNTIDNTLDAHGAVPEEMKLLYTNERHIIASFVEEYIITRCNKVICVTNAMKLHFINKYKNREKYEVVPISLKKQVDIDTVLKNKIKKDKPTIIYAGGLQPWQNIGLMNDIIKQTYEKYNYEIYVPNIEEYKKTLDEETIKHITISSKSNQELKEVLLKADYGFILRDDNVVNNVACPTKLIEYLEYGVIPIVKTNKIGDFSSYGMTSIFYNDVLSDITLIMKNDVIVQNRKVLVFLYKHA